MIVVGLLAAPGPATVVEVARRAAALGSKVEVAGVVPGTEEWDKVLFDLAAAGAGHATVVRSTGGSTEPADLDLALRYLPDIRCVVLVAPPARLLPVAIAGADFAGAPLVLVGPLDGPSLTALDGRGTNSTSPIVLDPPAEDPDGTFAGFIASLAVRLDAGDPPESAFRSTVAALAVDPA